MLSRRTRWLFHVVHREPGNTTTHIHPLRPLGATAAMSSGRNSPAPMENGFAAFRSRNPRSRFSRFGQNNARDSDEQQVCCTTVMTRLQETHPAPSAQLTTRLSEDHRRQYGTNGDTDSVPLRPSTTVQLCSQRAGFIASLFASKERAPRDLSRTISLGDSDRVRSRYPANVVSKPKVQRHHLPAQSALRTVSSSSSTSTFSWSH